MSNRRLDSISRPSQSKNQLKFKPKLVARKTKEERDASSSVSTPGINRKTLSQQQPQQRRLNANNRTNKRYQNTTLLSAGPLADGAVSVIDKDTTRPTRTSEPSQLVSKLRKRETKRIVKQEDHEFDNSAMDVDDVKINMGESKSELDLEDSDLFPVRAARSQHYEYGEEARPDDTIKTEFRREDSVVSRENSAEPELKPKATSTVITGTETDDSVNDHQLKQEKLSLQTDYDSLVKYMGQAGLGDEPKLMFVQLPPVLPKFKSSVKVEEGAEPPAPSGVIGTLRVHRSGKWSMKIGDVEFDVSGGGSSNFTQEVIAIDDEKKECYHLGSIGEKIIGAPRLI